MEEVEEEMMKSTRQLEGDGKNEEEKKTEGMVKEAVEEEEDDKKDVEEKVKKRFSEFGPVTKKRSNTHIVKKKKKVLLPGVWPLTHRHVTKQGVVGHPIDRPRPEGGPPGDVMTRYRVN